MRVGRPEQQSDIIRHLAHEFAPGPPCHVSPVAYSRERCPTGVRHSAQHFQVRVLPCDTSVSLIVVDDALGVLRMDVDPELGQGGVLFCTCRSHAHGLCEGEISRLRRGGRRFSGIADAPLARGLERRKIFPHLQPVSLLRQRREALVARENFCRAQSASDGDASYRQGLDRYGTSEFYIKNDAMKRVIIIINCVEGKIS